MNFNQLKVGEVLSESQHYVVKDIQRDRVLLKPDNGDVISVNRAYAESFLTSGEQFAKEQTITKTEIANLFLTNPYVALTVCFNKQVKAATIEEEILTAYENSTPKLFAQAVKKAIKNGLSGELRVMVGRHYGQVDDLGRVQFIDMQLEKDTTKDYDTRQRLVDPRTINYIILRGIKYTVK